MKISNKKKLSLNIFLLVLVFGIMFYVIRHSLSDILYELKDTPLSILFGITFLGVVYQFFEGWSIKATVEGFSKKFTILDGALTSCYAAFTRVVTFGAGTLLAEINYYKKKGLKVSQGVGVAALHMIMYKLAILTYALLAFVFQYSYLKRNIPSVMPFVLVGIIGTALLILFFLFITISLNLQILFVSISNKIFHKKKFREWIDRSNIQVYSLRETVYSILKDRTALFRIYLLNLLKLSMWYLLPFVILRKGHPEVSFPLFFAMISFTLVLSGVIPAPAGIGSFEFVYMLLFKPLVGTVDAVSSMLLYRFSSYVLPFILGFFYVLHDRKQAITGEVEEIKEENQMKN